MPERESVLETAEGSSPSRSGDYGPVRVEMHDTLGVIALGIISVLLLWALLKEQSRNHVLVGRLIDTTN